MITHFDVIKNIWAGERNVEAGSAGEVDLAAYMRHVWQPVIDAGGLADGYQLQLAYEIKGGDCKKCGKPWVKVKVNSYAVFEYYKPACSCFPRCPLCGRVLMAEVYNLDELCSSCKVGTHCQIWVDVNAGSGRERITKKERCGGLMVPTNGGKFKCKRCNDTRVIHVAPMVAI